MCGRVSVTTPAGAIAEFFNALNVSLFEDEVRYNIAPTRNLLAVHIDPERNQRLLRDFHWGLIPHWAKDMKIAHKLINARGETLAEKPSFRASFKYRRCIVPIDGFYEWKREGGVKQPYYFKSQSAPFLCFAALWAHWSGPNGEEIASCTLITTSANALMEPIHHRMPVLLDPADFELWLNPDIQRGEEVAHLIKPYEGDDLVAYPVSKYVNHAANEGEQCIEPIAEQGMLF